MGASPFGSLAMCLKWSNKGSIMSCSIQKSSEQRVYTSPAGQVWMQETHSIQNTVQAGALYVVPQQMLFTSKSTKTCGSAFLHLTCVSPFLDTY